jgi:hypothetical protein
MEAVPDSIKIWLCLNPELLVLTNPNSTDEEFDEALEKKLDQAIRWLEDNANHLSPNSEDSLSTTLAGKITIEGLLEATRETNNKGHVDITIKVISNIRKRLGEAKIYDGYAYHKKGIQQLVDRYSTGRERSGYMFAYVKEPDIKAKFGGLQAECDADKPCNQIGEGKGHKCKWAFETLHSHASGEELRVVHFGVNLHVTNGGSAAKNQRGKPQKP